MLHAVYVEISPPHSAQMHAIGQLPFFAGDVDCT